MRQIYSFGRVLSLVLLAVVGTSVLMYCAPGYFTDTREMDAAHAEIARTDLGRLHERQHSIASLLRGEAVQWLHGDLGQSRQFGTPVSTLLRERCWTSGRLLLAAVVAGWSAALLFAVPLSLSGRVSTDAVVAAATAVLLAIPVGALATICLLANMQNPVLVLATVVAARDFKVLHRILRATWQAPHLLYATAQGCSTSQLLLAHIAPALRRELLGVAVMSFTLALSALVPIEVVFDHPGLGQLAWGAAMNRDLPVLVAVTALVAACVGLASLVLDPVRRAEQTGCA